jgi:hypothetical protein
MQANRVILTLKKILAGKITDVLKKWGTTIKKNTRILEEIRCVYL